MRDMECKYTYLDTCLAKVPSTIVTAYRTLYPGLLERYPPKVKYMETFAPLT